ncbi:hypothetical protein RFI_02624, partial [Reticulomyxa filosa]
MTLESENNSSKLLSSPSTPTVALSLDELEYHGHSLVVAIQTPAGDWLKAPQGTYSRGNDGPDLELVREYSSWCNFRIRSLGVKRIRLKTANNMFVRAGHTGQRLNQSCWGYEFEEFTLQALPNMKIALKTCHSTFVTTKPKTNQQRPTLRHKKTRQCLSRFESFTFYLVTCSLSYSKRLE